MLKNNMLKSVLNKKGKTNQTEILQISMRSANTRQRTTPCVWPCSILFTRLKAYQYVKPVNNTTYGVFSSNSEHGILLVWILKEP